MKTASQLCRDIVRRNFREMKRANYRGRRIGVEFEKEPQSSNEPIPISTSVQAIKANFSKVSLSLASAKLKQPQYVADL